jgi:hypothetical protein
MELIIKRRTMVFVMEPDFVMSGTIQVVGGGVSYGFFLVLEHEKTATPYRLVRNEPIDRPG